MREEEDVLRRTYFHLRSASTNNKVSGAVLKSKKRKLREKLGIVGRLQQQK